MTVDFSFPELVIGTSPWLKATTLIFGPSIGRIKAEAIKRPPYSEHLTTYIIYYTRQFSQSLSKV